MIQKRFVTRIDLSFPLRPMVIQDVELRVNVTAQTIEFRLPGGQVFRTGLWLLIEGLEDQYGRGFDEVIGKHYIKQTH